MDCVYPIKLNDKDTELRLSLRSLKNIQHGRVFIVGQKPEWIKNVVYIPSHQKNYATRFQNSARNIYKACIDNRLSDDFILMNDDFFITEKMKSIPAFHRGPIKDLLDTEYSGKNTQWVRAMRRADYFLRQKGHSRLSYELHVPMVMNKHKFKAIYEQITYKHNLPHGAIRSIYGNVYKVGGQKIKDVKIYSPEEKIPTGPFFSTSPNSLKGAVVEHLRTKFPKKSKYEA